MAQIFPKWTNEIPKVGTPLFGLAGAFAIFAVWYWASPKHTDVGYKPQQPIPYSHKLHAGDMKIDCRYCHYNVERTSFAGVPPTQVCMNCHKQVKSDSPNLAWLRNSWRDGDPMHEGASVKWKRIHKIPDYAYFNHSAHVGVGFGENRAAVGCIECHGRVDTMEVVRQEQPLSMSWCLDCHNDPASHLRPVDQLTNMEWSADAAWSEKARAIAKTLNPPGSLTAVRTEGVDDKGNKIIVQRPTASCSGCHR
jgi:hypothetical protein